MPADGAPSDTVYQMLRDELDLDGRPNLNVASFVSTYMEKNAKQLMADNMAKNFADADEYPALMQIHERCISILAHLWGVQPGEKAAGTATTGSSEGIHLGGLAMKRRWVEKRQAEGKDTTRPNIIMGANAQVALEKFARYFDVEPRMLPVSKKSKYRLDPELIKESIDENTIGVFVILGSTYTGHYEPVEEISNILDDYQAKTGHDVPIHVDAASGGFIAPFTYAGVGAGKKWNFELPRVKSINVSGHKYGLVYPGVGWIIWRDRSYLPDHLIFKLDYLGGTMESFNLNFSRPGAQIIVQYFNLIHLGFSGYREIMENCLSNTRLLSEALEKTGWFTCVSEAHRKVSATDASRTAAINYTTNESDESLSANAKAEPSSSSRAEQIMAMAGSVRERVINAASVASIAARGTTMAVAADTSADYIASLPVVAFRLSDKFKSQFPHIQQQTISLLMRARQWIIPNYSLPPGEDDTKILRIVIRETMTFDLLDKLITDIVQVVESLIDSDEVDLSILQEQKHGVELKEERKNDKKGKDTNSNVNRNKANREAKMGEWTHRAVC